MYRLVYAQEVATDLQAIYDYIAADSPTRAAVYLGKIEKCILGLADFPNKGHKPVYLELDLLGIKILPFEDYLIFYTVNEQDKRVNIVRVLNGAVNYKKLF